MKLEFGYGEGVQEVDIPDRNLLAVLESNPMNHERKGAEAVSYGLENPIGSPKLRNLVRAGQKIAIVTSDISRPLPSSQILPPVLEELYIAGVPRENITVVFALGSHRRHSEEEKIRLVGEQCYSQVRCIDSDSEDYVHMGVTKRGTPVDITRSVADSEVRFCN